MATETSPAPALPLISTSDEFLDESEEFLGVITGDEYQHGEYGWQWHLMVRPVDIALKGESGAFHTWAKPTKRLRSKMGVQRQALAKLWPDTILGMGHLIGRVAWWVRRDIPFGMKDGEQIVAEGVLVPVRPATEDEAARASHLPLPAAGPPETPPAPTWTDEAVATVLDLYADHKVTDAKRAAARAPISPELKNAILSGHALEYLQDQGLVTVDGDGFVRRLDA